MSGDLEPTTPIDRRRLFRGGAMLAGVAGVAAASSVLKPGVAQAGIGDPVAIGSVNLATASTTLQLEAVASAPLVLHNTKGPALSLARVAEDWAGDLAEGEFAWTQLGMAVGADYGQGAETVLLATSRTIEDLPATFAIDPVRMLDTRAPVKRETIVASSTDPFTSKGRLKAGAWIDVAVAPVSAGLVYSAVFANLTAVSPTKSGYLSAYPPGDYSGTSTVNFQSGKDTANGTFMSVSQVKGFYALRIRASANTHVLLDVTGALVTVDNSRSSSSAAKADLLKRQQAQAKVRDKVHASLASVAR